MSAHRTRGAHDQRYRERCEVVSGASRRRRAAAAAARAVRFARTRPATDGDATVAAAAAGRPARRTRRHLHARALATTKSDNGRIGRADILDVSPRSVPTGVVV